MKKFLLICIFAFAVTVYKTNSQTSNAVGGVLNFRYSLSMFQLQAYNTIGLSAHNIARSIHGVKSLKLNTTLATQAQSWSRTIANMGYLLHSYGYGLGVWYGENLFFVCDLNLMANSTYLSDRATMNWYAEIVYYNYSAPGYNGLAGHFTQLVWNETTQVGFGITITNNTIGTTNLQCAWIVARYTSGGNINYPEAFAANVPVPKGYPNNIQTPDWSKVVKC